MARRLDDANLRFANAPRIDVGSRVQLRDEAASYVRELIISGQAAPGTLLRLGPLAESIAASVTPVREALLLLAQDGWIVQEPNRGFRVLPIKRDDVSDTYLIHSFVAGELASRASRAPRNARDSAVEEMRRLDAQISDLDATHDFQHVEDLNYRLHHALYDLAASPRLVWFVRAASRFVPRRFWGTIPGWLEHNRDGHRPVIDAVARCDPDQARDLMARHIEGSGALLIAHLDSTEVWSADIGPGASDSRDLEFAMPPQL